jgi:hypothetical protein
MTLTVKVSQLWHRRAPRPSARHLWAITTATTSDGVVAHVQIEFTLHVGAVDADPDALDRATMDAVEGVLRYEIGRRPIASLPMAGTPMDWVPPNLVPGATIGNVFVTSSDVEVTQELRRLVTNTAGP